MKAFIASNEIVSATHSEYEFTLQTNSFIASDEIVFATQLQIRITLQTNMFIASDKHGLCWGQILLALEMNAFGAGDKRVRAGD